MVVAGKHMCCNKKEVKRGAWSPAEDEKLRNHILNHGVKSWTTLPDLAGLQRCGKSCRLRWLNHLRPGTKRGNFSTYEVDLITELHKRHGNKWTEIVKHLPGRTDNDVKNFWNMNKRKQQKVAVNDDVVANNDLQVQAVAALQQDNSNLINNNPIHRQYFENQFMLKNIYYYPAAVRTLMINSHINDQPLDMVPPAGSSGNKGKEVVDVDHCSDFTNVVAQPIHDDSLAPISLDDDFDDVLQGFFASTSSPPSSSPTLDSYDDLLQALLASSPSLSGAPSSSSLAASRDDDISDFDDVLKGFFASSGISPSSSVPTSDSFDDMLSSPPLLSSPTSDSFSEMLEALLASPPPPSSSPTSDSFTEMIEALLASPPPPSSAPSSKSFLQ